MKSLPSAIRSSRKNASGRIQQVSQGDGRTVIFVSHNIGAIRKLCDRAAYLRNGTLVSAGPAEQVVTEYLNSAVVSDEKNLLTRPRFPGIAASISGFSCKPAPGADHVISGAPVTFEVEMINDHMIPNAAVSVMFNSDQGYRVLAFSSRCERRSGDFQRGRVADYIQHATAIDVEFGDFYGNGQTLLPFEGPILARSHWTFA
jgi:lipopolysaccharide transport system ATP-binding protein